MKFTKKRLLQIIHEELESVKDAKEQQTKSNKGTKKK
jgi:hypothetical protein